MNRIMVGGRSSFEVAIERLVEAHAAEINALRDELRLLQGSSLALPPRSSTGGFDNVASKTRESIEVLRVPVDGCDVFVPAPLVDSSNPGWPEDSAARWIAADISPKRSNRSCVTFGLESGRSKSQLEDTSAVAFDCSDSPAEQLQSLVLLPEQLKESSAMRPGRRSDDPKQPRTTQPYYSVRRPTQLSTSCSSQGVSRVRSLFSAANEGEPFDVVAAEPSVQTRRASRECSPWKEIVSRGGSVNLSEQRSSSAVGSSALGHSVAVYGKELADDDVFPDWFNPFVQAGDLQAQSTVMNTANLNNVVSVSSLLGPAAPQSDCFMSRFVITDVANAGVGIQEVSRNAEQAWLQVCDDMERQQELGKPSADSPDYQIETIPCVGDFPVAWDFYFLPADFIKKHDTQTPLPHHQELRSQDKLVKKRCSLEDVFLGRLRDTHAAVSYRWHGPEDPDPQGVRLQRVQQHLQNNPKVEWVWMDWPCLPQTISKEGVSRTEEEKKFFDGSLTMINLLYLGCMVFIIFDSQYNGRFWTGIEAWMSLQEVNESGFSPEDDTLSRRSRVECIGASGVAEAQEEAESLLLKMWGNKNLAQVISVLQEDDIQVTNKGDKKVQFEKLRELESNVGDLFGALVKPEQAAILKAEKARHRQLKILSLWTEKNLNVVTSRSMMSRGFRNTDTTMENRETGMLALIISDPGSNFRLAWESCGAVLILWDCVTVPLFVFERPEDTLTTVVDWVALIFWTFNVVASLLVGYTFTTPKGVAMEMRLKLIVWNYLRTWFIVDAVVLVPDWIVTVALTLDAENSEATGQDVSQVARVVRFVRIVRLVRLPKLWYVISRLGSHLDSDYIILLMHLVVMILVLVCTAHLIACVWFLVADSADSAHGMTWVKAYHLSNAHWSSQYLSSLHWAIAQFVPASIEIEPQNNAERVCAVIMAIVAFVGFSCFVGKVSNLLMDLQNLTENETRKINQVRRYLLSNRISPGLGVRVQRQLELVVQNKKARREAPDIMKKLSASLDGELQWALLSPYLVAHPLFEFLDRLSRADAGEAVGICQTLRRIAREIAKKKYLPASETYFSQGTRGNRVGFRIGGLFIYAQQGAHENKPKEPIVVSRHDEWFSEPVFWASNWVHLGTLTALTEAEIVHFDFDGKQLDQFGDIIKQNPFVFDKVQRYASSFVRWINEKKAHESANISDVMNSVVIGQLVPHDLLDAPDWAQHYRRFAFSSMNSRDLG